MATVPLSSFAPNSSLAAPAGTTLGATNTVSTNGVPLEEVVLQVVTSTATTVLTVKAGSNPPALSAGQGDLAVSCPVGTTWIGPFTSARFAQGMQPDRVTGGILNVDSATGANQSVTAFRLPRTA